MTEESPKESATPIVLSWKHKVFLVFFGIFLTSAALEGVLRVQAALEHRGASAEGVGSNGEYWATYEPELGYRGNPKFPGYNSEGFHDREFTPKSGQFRVMVLGDSVAVGGDSPTDTFPSYIEQNLQKAKSPRPLEVINVSVRGYTNYQELLFLKKYAGKYQPDALLVQFCLNDLHKFLHSFQVEDGKIVPGSYQFSTEAMKEATGLGRLVRKSLLLSWLAGKLPVASSVVGAKLSGEPEFVHGVDIGSAWREDAWPPIASQVAEMQQWAKAHGIPILMTVVPPKVQYTTAHLQKDKAFVLLPQTRLREICERLGIPFYDLYPDLSAERFIDSIHFDQQGRKMIGARLARFLAESGALPANPAK